jgi:hypothetical protein
MQAKEYLDFIIDHSGATRQLTISFGDLHIEILLLQNCLFIFELDSYCIFFLPSESHIHSLLVLSLKN